jgi:hypothetical protein
MHPQPDNSTGQSNDRSCDYCGKSAPVVGEHGWCTTCEADLARTMDASSSTASTFVAVAIATARHEGMDDEAILDVVVAELNGRRQTRIEVA